MKKTPDNTCPTCDLPFGFVRCPVTILGLKECLLCAIHRQNEIAEAGRKV